MKYLKLFNESSDESIDASILLDVLNDLKDEYNSIDFSCSGKNSVTNYIQIKRGNEVISESEVSDAIKRALDYYYRETGITIYAEVRKLHYFAFFSQNIIRNQKHLCRKSADFILKLRKERVKEWSRSILFSRNGIVNLTKIQLNDEVRINEDRQFETIDMSIVSDIFAELIDNYENIKIEYGTNFIKLVKEPLDNPFDKFDNEMLEKNIDYTLMRALSIYFDITDLNIFYFVSKKTLENFYKDSNEDRYLWIYYDFYDPTLVSNYKFNYKIYCI